MPNPALADIRLDDEREIKPQTFRNFSQANATALQMLSPLMSAASAVNSALVADSSLSIAILDSPDDCRLKKFRGLPPLARLRPRYFTASHKQ